jgi:hypothetical protein
MGGEHFPDEYFMQVVTEVATCERCLAMPDEEVRERILRALEIDNGLDRDQVMTFVYATYHMDHREEN